MLCPPSWLLSCRNRSSCTNPPSKIEGGAPAGVTTTLCCDGSQPGRSPSPTREGSHGDGVHVRGLGAMATGIDRKGLRIFSFHGISPRNILPPSLTPSVWKLLISQGLRAILTGRRVKRVRKPQIIKGLNQKARREWVGVTRI